MPDGTLFVTPGSLNGFDQNISSNNNPTYEILSPKGIARGTSVISPLLVKAQPYYLYPFIHLLNDRTLFVFAGRSSEVFDVASDPKVKDLPDLVIARLSLITPEHRQVAAWTL